MNKLRNWLIVYISVSSASSNFCTLSDACLWFRRVAGLQGVLHTEAGSSDYIVDRPSSGEKQPADHCYQSTN